MTSTDAALFGLVFAICTFVVVGAMVSIAWSLRSISSAIVALAEAIKARR